MQSQTVADKGIVQCKIFAYNFISDKKSLLIKLNSSFIDLSKQKLPTAIIFTLVYTYNLLGSLYY